MIIGIVCTDRNWGIGKNNDLLFHLKKDMQFFRQTTADSIVFCGYNTLLSFPGSKPLKGRSTICLCPEEVNRDDCYCIHDFNEAVKLVRELSKTKTVFVIGGAMLYQSMLPYYDKVYVNRVCADGGAEVFFPNLDAYPNLQLWQILPEVKDEGYNTQLYVYVKNIPLEQLEG
jgi:dihydrofolate reductase